MLKSCNSIEGQIYLGNSLNRKTSKDKSLIFEQIVVLLRHKSSRNFIRRKNKFVLWIFILNHNMFRRTTTKMRGLDEIRLRDDIFLEMLLKKEPIKFNNCCV